MADTPPPLPLETPLAPSRALDEGRVCPPPAPLLWRTLAFLADAVLLSATSFVLLYYLLPYFKASETSALIAWFEKTGDMAVAMWKASASGDVKTAETLAEQMRSTQSAPPTSAQEALSFIASWTFVIHWVGFSLMEIFSGGASIGKKMFNLKVVRFPHAEKPTVFDSVARSCWKTMAVVGGSPIAWIFAIVDAHWPLFNPLKRSLHDILSRTLVLDARFDSPEDKKKGRRGDA